MNWHPQPAYISTLWTHYAVRCLTSYFLNKCWWGGSYCGQETDNFAGFWPPFHYHGPRGDESSVGTNSTLWVQHLRKVAGSESLPHDILFDLLISEKSQETFLGVFCLFFFFFKPSVVTRNLKSEGKWFWRRWKESVSFNASKYLNCDAFQEAVLSLNLSSGKWR